MRRAGAVLLVLAWLALLWGLAHLLTAQVLCGEGELGRGVDMGYSAVRSFTASAVCGAAGLVMLHRTIPTPEGTH